MRTLCGLLLLAALALAGEPRILGHEVTLTLDPEAGTFESIDRVLVEGPGRLSIPRLPGVTVEGADRDLDALEQEVVLRFAGTLPNAIEKAAAPTWVAGDRTAGIVSPKGSYLVGGFYAPSPDPTPFRVTVRVPLPHRAVSQGRRLSESEREGVHEAVYGSATPMDGLVVVTGPWKVQEREIDGVSCRTYLYAEDERHAALLFSTLAHEVPRFQRTFAMAVPEGRFDVVENFFATGYGFPNFTLLGDTVIRYVCAKTTGPLLPSGYLDHELVHCWLGNHLLVDYAKGNWCEALTTYFANYGSAAGGGPSPAARAMGTEGGSEAKSSPEDPGREYRAKVSRSFSLRVTPANDYPLRAFQAKSHAFENDIGYGKGSMVFAMLAREIGEEAFLVAVRHAVATRGGRKLGWDDLVTALSEGAGRDLKEWFEPWLARTGAPILSFGDLRATGARLVGTILQEQPGPAYALTVPIRVRTAEGIEEHLVPVASKECIFSLPTPLPVFSLSLDPDHRLFRATPRARVAPCLEAVLTAGRRVGFGDPALLGRLGIEVVEPSLPLDAAVLSIGAAPEEILAVARAQDPTFRRGDGFFEMRGVRYGEPGDGILISASRPQAPEFPVTLFLGNGEAAFARTAYLPYYSSDGWVVFRQGQPVARGAFDGDRAAHADIGPARTGEPETIAAMLLLLADPVHEGRRAGSNASYLLANTLRGELFRRGLKVVAWPPVLVPLAKCEEMRLRLGGETLDDACFPFHRSSMRAEATPFIRVVEHPAEEVKGALVLLPEGAGEEVALRYAEEGAAVVAVASSDEALTARGEEAAWEGALPPAIAERIAKRGLDPELALAGMVSRSAGRLLPCPYVYVKASVAQRLRDSQGGGDLAMRLMRSETSTSNLLGVFGEGREPGVLLSAHWDGVVGAAASDNAAGVAVVLWVAEQLRRDFEAGRLKRPVVICLFGGEEAGLLGSRQFAKAVLSPNCPIGRPALAINVDGIGNGGSDEVFLIGRSHHPALLAAFEGSLGDAGLVLGKDIDAYAFRQGSDHWPLHESGIPAVTVYNAHYRTMNTARDTLERIDVGNVRRVASAVYRTVRRLASE